MATKGFRDIFAHLTTVLVVDASENDVELARTLVAKSMNHDAPDRRWPSPHSFLGVYLELAKAAYSDRYTAPTVTQADEIDGLLEAWADYLLGRPTVSEAKVGMSHGIWDHFKGGVYLTQKIGRLASAEDDYIIEYLSMIHGTTHYRTASEWNEIVRWPDGKYRSRFVYRGRDLTVRPPVFKVSSPKLQYELLDA